MLEKTVCVPGPTQSLLGAGLPPQNPAVRVVLQMNGQFTDGLDRWRMPFGHGNGGQVSSFADFWML